MTVLFTGETRLGPNTQNPWLATGWARRTRRHLSATTLDFLPTRDLAFAAQALAAAGFDVVSLANPNLMAQGIAELDQAIHVLRDNHIPTIGAGIGDDAYVPHVISRSGQVVGVVAAAQTDPELWATVNRTGVANLLDPRVVAAGRLARQEGATSIYLMLHARSRLRLPQIDFGRLLVDFDGIIVSGSRIPLPVRQATSGFVVAPGVFHDATSSHFRWGTVAWAEAGRCKLSAISQRADPPLTKSGTRFPLKAFAPNRR